MHLATFYVVAVVVVNKMDIYMMLLFFNTKLTQI